jgi:hypothetical protein
MDSSIGATVGILLGYISAEVATVAAFERLLWPQRYYYEYGGFQSMLKAILFMPLGGVLHKPTLQALDKLQKNGLLFQSRRGHMLGTPFYSNCGLKFDAPAEDPELDVECRNGLLVSTLEFCSRKFSSETQNPTRVRTSRDSDSESSHSFSHSNGNGASPKAAENTALERDWLSLLPLHSNYVGKRILSSCCWYYSRRTLSQFLYHPLVFSSRH